VKHMSPLTKWLLFVVGLIILGCGGGGGGGVVAPTNVTLTGRVVWVGTGGPPNPVASVRVGTTSVATDAFDGFFEIPAPSGTDQVIVTYSPSTGSPVIQTFTFTAATANRDLGDLYIGPETVSVRGRAVSSSGGAEIAGGAVTFAGRSATTDASGVFILTQVAYDPASQAVFFGLRGTIAATGFFDGFFSPASPPVGGVVDVGDVALSPVGGGDPPPLPFNLTGLVQPTATGALATVELRQGTTLIRTATADINGRYKLWVPAGTYTLTATKGAQSGSEPVTITQPSQLTTVNVTLN